MNYVLMVRLKMSRCGCLVLVCGIPASGKTTFTQQLSGHHFPPGGVPPFLIVPVHTDVFYPLDCRGLQVDNSDPFNLKEARCKVDDCLRHLIRVNGLGLRSPLERQDGPPPQSWEKLAKWLVDSKFADGAGKLSYPGNVAIVIDENFYLRSMRHEYYQMARDYGLGFVEVFLQCSLPVALARNDQRPSPLPPSTVEKLEHAMEGPDPKGHCWEKNRSVLFNTDCCWDEFIPEARAKVLSLITDSFCNPVHPLLAEDLEAKASCRLENLNNHSHQADIVLRRCVSEAMKQPCVNKLEAALLAKRVNSVRREILDQLKAGKVDSCWKFEADSDEFKSSIQDMFLCQCYSITDKYINDLVGTGKRNLLSVVC